MPDQQKSYLPAAGHDWALPLYDPVVRIMGIGRVWDALINQASIAPGQRVLDIGCGTGGLVVRLKQLHPDVTVVGLDPDAKALARAQRKSEAAGAGIQLDQAFSDRMPYPGGSFDRVLSSFMFHHLSKEAKIRTLSEVRRVLGPGGSLHLVDFAGRPGAHGFLMRIFHAGDVMADNAADRVITRMREAGFATSARVKRQALFLRLFRVNYYRAAV
ncbi:MAG: class I SAM-dependent methyltransferase [Acidobacteriota bacterium]